ncbi:MAG: peptide chain release factor N(5)-glutamine methyltransferase [Ramlibacter sp.]|nr:peptide chain release factor N(5)-glutamine methyltransferase [Ramlibacter sp.]
MQRLLLCAMGRPRGDRAWLLAHGDGAVPAEASARFQELVQRLRDGEPMAYLIGSQDFYGLELQVDARVLVPRPDTETLVDWVLEVLPPTASADVLDLGTGSGAIALAIRHQRGRASVTAVDRSPEALDVARANAQRLGLDVRFLQGDWLEGVSDHYDLIVSNPPYVAQDDAHLPALRHEPEQALVAGQDGLDDLRRIASGAGARLRPGGWLLLEHGWHQAGAVRELLASQGYEGVSSRKDLAGIERCTGGQWPGLG